MSLLKPLHPKFPVVLPLLMQLFHQIQRLRPRPGLRNPSLPNVGPRDAFLILECRGKSCDMTWQYIPWGWSHLDQIKTWFQRWKLSVIIVYLQSCMIHVLAWKKWNCHWCWSIHPVGFTIFCFMGDTRGADHAFRSSKQTWEKIAYMRWIQPFVLLPINKEHCWIMIHLTVCQVSLLAKFSVVLHPTSAMEFQPQQVWVKVAEHAWSNHRWAYHSI